MGTKKMEPKPLGYVASVTLELFRKGKAGFPYLFSSNPSGPEGRPDAGTAWTAVYTELPAKVEGIRITEEQRAQMTHIVGILHAHGFTKHAERLLAIMEQQHDVVQHSAEPHRLT